MHDWVESVGLWTYFGPWMTLLVSASFLFEHFVRAFPLARTHAI